ncbi:hypothetical protein MTO96_000511 [Rhipicephalus appendiculatus]
MFREYSQPRDSYRSYSERSDATDHSSVVPTFASPNEECQTELTRADLAALEDAAYRRCSSPFPMDDCSSDSYEFMDNPADCTYEPTLDDSSLPVSEEDGPLEGPTKRKFLVYEDQLLELVKLCRTCLRPATSSLEVLGSLVAITTTCEYGHAVTWQSQPKSRHNVLSNIALDASTLFTGCSPMQTLRFLRNAGISCFSNRTYYSLQRDFLFPAVNKPPLSHLFDAWHVNKGLKKQLMAAARHQGCEIIGLWTRSIVGHLYFSVGAGKGNGDLAIAVWLSLLNHVQNKHTGHGLLYPECQHGDLEPRKWILPGTDAYDRLHAMVVSKRLLDDIKQVSPNFQTFGVESFYSIINRFAPKCYAFSHQGQLARCLLSALHYNENSGRMQATTRGGDLRWQIKHSKARRGEPVACPIKELPTYAYVNHLLSAVEELLVCGSKGGTDATPQPPHLSTTFGPVDKVVIVEGHRSRFVGN